MQHFGENKETATIQYYSSPLRIVSNPPLNMD